MRIILDSNVYIAAYIARVGVCHELLEYCLTNETIIISNTILDEVRNKLLKKIKLPSQLVENIIYHIKKNSELTQLGTETEIITCRDPKDSPIIQLLLQTKADLLITGDKDLLEEKKLKKRGIISPRGFMKKYMSSL